MLFEQGQECPACGGISAGEEDPPKTGIQLAEVCWEDWEDWGGGGGEKRKKMRSQGEKARRQQGEGEGSPPPAFS